MSFLDQTMSVPGKLWASASLGGGGGRLAQRQDPVAAGERGPDLERDGTTKGGEGFLPSDRTAFISVWERGGVARVDGPAFSFLPFFLPQDLPLPPCLDLSKSLPLNVLLCGIAVLTGTHLFLIS